jgi:ribonuclease E
VTSIEIVLPVGAPLVAPLPPEALPEPATAPLPVETLPEPAAAPLPPLDAPEAEVPVAPPLDTPDAEVPVAPLDTPDAGAPAAPLDTPDADAPVAPLVAASCPVDEPASPATAPLGAGDDGDEAHADSASIDPTRRGHAFRGTMLPA